jgi:c-di-GMP-binding flagellar brake protein YcgR
MSLPTKGSVVIPLEKGLHLNLTFLCNGKLFHCNGEITDRYKEGQLYLMSVRLTSELERLQRRKFYRLPYSLEINYRKDEEEELWITTQTIDLSGGGCRMNTVETFEPGTYLELSFALKMASGIHKQEWLGKVSSCEPIPNKPSEYETRVEFLDTERRKRELLVKFIFEEERRIRRKERGRRGNEEENFNS